MERHRFSQKKNEQTAFAPTYSLIVCSIFGESTVGESAYSFIKPLMGHFWLAELALWDEHRFSYINSIKANLAKPIQKVSLITCI